MTLSNILTPLISNAIARLSLDTSLYRQILSCIVVIIVLVGLFCLALYLKSVSDYKQAVNNIVFEEIDITKIPDGIYAGECNVNFIYAKKPVEPVNGQDERAVSPLYFWFEQDVLWVRESELLRHPF